MRPANRRTLVVNYDELPIRQFQDQVKRPVPGSTLGSPCGDGDLDPPLRVWKGRRNPLLESVANFDQSTAGKFAFNAERNQALLGNS